MIIFMIFKISKIYDSIVYLKQFFKTFFFIYCLILVQPPKKCDDWNNWENELGSKGQKNIFKIYYV